MADSCCCTSCPNVLSLPLRVQPERGEPCLGRRLGSLLELGAVGLLLRVRLDPGEPGADRCHGSLGHQDVPPEVGRLLRSPPLLLGRVGVGSNVVPKSCTSGSTASCRCGASGRSEGGMEPMREQGDIGALDRPSAPGGIAQAAERCRIGPRGQPLGRRR